MLFTQEDTQESRIVVPDGKGGSASFSLKRVYEAEARIQDIAVMNAHKAPELLATFNLAFLDCNQYLRELELCLHHLQRAANTRRSVVILDEVPKILREKGLFNTRQPSGSEDMRTAILDQDEEYLNACSAVAQVKACIALLKGKSDGFEQAFSSVKKILGESQDWRDGLSNKQFSAGGEQSRSPEPISPGSSTVAATGVRSFFGKAR